MTEARWAAWVILALVIARPLVENYVVANERSFLETFAYLSISAVLLDWAIYAVRNKESD